MSRNEKRIRQPGMRISPLASEVMQALRPLRSLLRLSKLSRVLLPRQERLALAVASPSWRLSPEMRWFRKKNTRTRDPALAVAQAAARVSLMSAETHRDREVRKLATERSEVVEPLMRIHAGNHFAELATRAFRRNGRR